jgi:hypothetical protein
MSDEARPAVGSEKVVTINTRDGELWARMYAASLAREQELLADRERLMVRVQEFLDVFDDENAWIENSDNADYALDDLRRALAKMGGRDDSTRTHTNTRDNRTDAIWTRKRSANGRTANGI